ncbi:MAG: hypothetical protein ACKVQB_10915 [Bacteroidia bacterium]
MHIKVHSNYLMASYLVFFLGALSVIKFLLAFKVLNRIEDKLTAIINLIIFLGIGYIVMKGFNWVKYLLLILSIFGMIQFSEMIKYFIQKPNPKGACLITQRIMLVFATLILFKIPKNS